MTISGRETGRSTGVSGTVVKAIHVLEAVAASTEAVALVDLTTQLKMDKSTLFRLLSTLVETGYLSQDLRTKRYSLSYKVVSLARNLLAENRILNVAREVMQELVGQTDETAHLNVLDGHESVVVQKVRGTQLVDIQFEIGDRGALHYSSIGKVFLAFQDVRFVEEVLSEPLPAITPFTITDPERLRRELQKVRSQGYAIDNNEMREGLRCIAAPIFGRDGLVRMGISISGPASRFSLKKLDELRTPLMAAARTISERFGGLPPSAGR